MRSHCFHWGAVLLAILFASRCASDAPAKKEAASPAPLYLTHPEEHVHPACPAGTFLHAVGGSPKSGQDALVAAKASLSRQVSAHIESVISRDVMQRSDNGKIQVSYVNQQNIRERSAFTHGELIFSPESPSRVGADYLALVCMEKSKAVDALLRDASTSLTQFETSAAAALKHDSSGDLSSFTAAFVQAQTAATACLPLMTQVAALEETRASSFFQTWKALVASAQDILARTAVGLQVDAAGFPSDLQKEWTGALLAALAANGVPAQAVEGCVTHVTHALKLVGRADCGWGTLGHTCEPSFSLSLVHCATRRTVVDARVPAPLRKVSHPQSQEKALRKAAEPVSAALSSEWMRSLLAREIPLAVSP